MVTFFWNRIKGSDKELIRVYYTQGPWVTLPKEVITITARGGQFSREIAEVFKVENNSDSQEDYFEPDRIRVFPNHPFYTLVRGALEQQEVRLAAKHKRAA